MKNNFLVYLCTIGVWIILLSCTVALPIAFNGTITVMDGKVAKNSKDAVLTFRDETPRLFLSKDLNTWGLAKIRFWPWSSAGEVCKRIEKGFWYSAKASSCD